jgi:hypothetical protein
MDRYQDLIEKRDGPGLTDDEADELGRLMAERQGEPYANANDPPLDVEAERESKDTQEYVEEQRESREGRDVDDSVMTREGQSSRETDNPPVA